MSRLRSRIRRKYQIASLISRLNSPAYPRVGAGLELTGSCPKVLQNSPEQVTKSLKSFVSKIKKATGVERNLFAKRFIESISYSPERIKISLFANAESAGGFSPKNSVSVSPVGLELDSRQSKNSLYPQNKKFVLNSIAPSGARASNRYPERMALL